MPLTDLVTDLMQNLKILNLFTLLPIHFQLNLNTNTEHVNSLNEAKREQCLTLGASFRSDISSLLRSAPVSSEPPLAVDCPARGGLTKIRAVCDQKSF